MGVALPMPRCQGRHLTTYTREGDGLWLDFVRSALRLAAVLFWVDRCFGSWVLLGFSCLLPAGRLPASPGNHTHARDNMQNSNLILQQHQNDRCSKYSGNAIMRTNLQFQGTAGDMHGVT